MGVYIKNVYEKPNLEYRQQVLEKYKNRPDFDNHFQQLEDKGFVALPNYISEKDLKELQCDFESIMEGKEYNEVKSKMMGNEDIRKSRLYSQYACEEYLTDIVRCYIGKPIYLARSTGTRSESAEIPDMGSYKWHHDEKRKMVKIMILLTEMPLGEQGTSYVPGSHKVWQNNNRSSRFTEEEIQEIEKEFDSRIQLSGHPGTVFIFDPNGFHRGNKNGVRRDHFGYTYTAGRSLYPFSGFHPRVIDCIEEREKEILRIKS
mgnify:CR=1 FL=1